VTKALLDTNIISAFMKGNPKVIDSLSHYIKRHQQLSLSIITHYELLRGLKAIGNDKRIAALQAFMGQCEIIPLTQPIIEIAAEIYATLKNKGILIEDADILIAATALHKGMSVVTGNLEHFKRVKGLKISNWLA
jgi:tRNA(fMet)-specific endonuclease VapC